MRKIAIMIAFIGVLTLAGFTNRTNSSSSEENYIANQTVSSSSEKNYIANRNSGKLHSTNCDSLPYEKNRIYFATIEEAHAAGYTNQHKECMGN
ncbi:MAG: hypothetical protein K2H93_03890 [Oscillospiraceae bacterium]|nr:hypothetical protein [Oscillospiraceae bacterium]